MNNKKMRISMLLFMLASYVENLASCFGWLERLREINRQRRHQQNHRPQLVSQQQPSVRSPHQHSSSHNRVADAVVNYEGHLLVAQNSTVDPLQHNSNGSSQIPGDPNSRLQAELEKIVE